MKNNITNNITNNIKDIIKDIIKDTIKDAIKDIIKDITNNIIKSIKYIDKNIKTINDTGYYEDIMKKISHLQNTNTYNIANLPMMLKETEEVENMKRKLETIKNKYKDLEEKAKSLKKERNSIRRIHRKGLLPFKLYDLN